MRNYVSIISLFILPFVLLAGCKMGPTKGQTRQALKAIIKSMESSFEDVDGLDDVQVNAIYANGADIVFENKEGSVITAASVFRLENEDQVHGNSTIANYEDPESGYIINGELTYSFWFPNHSRDVFYGEVSGSMDLSGGKIESLEFSASVDLNGNEVFDTTANNYPVYLKYYDNFFEMLKDMGWKVRG
jgi:hypothetical protein